MGRQIEQTDEYTISLHRELARVQKTIQRIEESLGILKRKHDMTTEMFIDELQSNTLPDNPDYKGDYEVWRRSYESLKRWDALERQYQEAFRTMMI
jgi:hypothetical protein